MGTSGENIKDLKKVGAGSAASTSDPQAEFTSVSSPSEDLTNQSELGTAALTGLESTELDPEKEIATSHYTGFRERKLSWVEFAFKMLKRNKKNNLCFLGIKRTWDSSIVYALVNHCTFGIICCLSDYFRKEHPQEE